MKLDKRLKISPFNCFDSKRARRFIDKMGYFSNNLGDFSDLTKCKFGTLGSIHDVYSTAFSYNVFRRKEDGAYYEYFIPESFLKPKEKKFRPYTLEELPIKVCDIIYLKNKNSEIIERCLCISISSEGNQIKSITLGVNSYSIQELFENYVWRHSDLWDFQPFGVEE
jgi:hypothetical protein